MTEGDAALEKRPGINARRGVTLEINNIAIAVPALGFEKMIKANLVEGGRRREGGYMTADTALFAVGAHNHGHRVPADNALDPPFYLTTAGIGRLLVNRNGIDIGCIGREMNIHAVLPGTKLESP